MSGRRRCGFAPKKGKSMSISAAAKEAFDCLNAGMRKEFRGWGDTRTAARDRAATKAGVTPAQGTRLWKHWQTMASVDGDVYRALRNKYGHLCAWIENAAESMELEQQTIEATDATDKGHSPMGEGVDRAPQGAASRKMKQRRP